VAASRPVKPPNIAIAGDFLVLAGAGALLPDNRRG
jgi:hypothetical protein